MATKTDTINMLILDPSSNDAEQTINILRNNGLAVRATQINNEEELELALEKQIWDLFIVRDDLKNPSAEQCVKIVKHFGAEISFIMTTSNYSIEKTVAALQLGMKDVVPEDNDEYFKLVVERELESIGARRGKKLADLALVETDKRNELLLDSSRDAVAYITDGMHIYANHAYMTLFGYDDAEELESMPIMDLIDSKQHGEFKKYLKNHAKGKASEEFNFNGLNQDGTTFKAIISLSDSKYDGEDCTQVYINTAGSSDEELEQKLKEITTLDRLTGLYNQSFFVDAINDSISKAINDEKMSSILYMELDNYDQIQSDYGIANSDLYLKEVADWLKEQLPSGTIIARIGDSTFTLLSENDNLSVCESSAKDLCEEFAAHLFEVASKTMTDSLSIGICPILETSDDADKLLSDAHIACSRVQSKGGNSIRVHDNSLDSLNNRKDAQIAMELQDAMDANRIHLMYEPVVNFQGTPGQMFNVNLAIETENGEKKNIEDMFNINHKTSTALKLDNWMMQESLKEFSSYRIDHPECKLKLKLAAASLLDENLISNISGLLEQYKIPKESLICEFQETDIVAHLKLAIDVFNRMAKKELSTALSGFGVTLDSQAIVNSINCSKFSWVTIEDTLFNDLIGNNEVQAKIQELVTFAHVNELKTIAPGISDPGTLATIWPMNIGYIYGEYITTASSTLDFDFSDVSF